MEPKGKTRKTHRKRKTVLQEAKDKAQEFDEMFQGTEARWVEEDDIFGILFVLPLVKKRLERFIETLATEQYQEVLHLEPQKAERLWNHLVQSGKVNMPDVGTPPEELTKVLVEALVRDIEDSKKYYLDKALEILHKHKREILDWAAANFLSQVCALVCIAMQEEATQEMFEAMGTSQLTRTKWANKLVDGYELRMKDFLQVSLGKPKEKHKEYPEKPRFLQDIQDAISKVQSPTREKIAEQLNISTTTLWRRCRDYNIDLNSLIQVCQESISEISKHFRNYES